MIIYSKQLTGIGLLARLHGSPVWRALPYGLLAAVISIILNSIGGVQEWLEEQVVHPYIFQVFAFVVGFVIVFRSNQSLARYAEGRAALQQMQAKWMDAALEAMTLDAAGLQVAPLGGDDDEVVRADALECLRRMAAFHDRVCHAASLLSASALLYLRRDDAGGRNIRCVNMSAAASGEMWGWRAASVPAAARTGDSDGDGNGNGDSAGTVHAPAGVADGALSGIPAGDGHGEGWDEESDSDAEGEGYLRRCCSPTSCEGQIRQLIFGPYSNRVTRAHNAARQMAVLGPLSASERRALGRRGSTPDGVTAARVLLESAWQARQRDTRCGLGTCSPPIVSRIPQFLSDGNLGFNNAKKIADVPFAYPMAVSVSILLVLYTLLVPLLIESRCRSGPLAAVLSFLAVFAYWIMNESAREIEDPFVYGPNELPLAHMQNEFNARLLAVRAAAWRQAKDACAMAYERQHDPHAQRAWCEKGPGGAPLNPSEKHAQDVFELLPDGVDAARSRPPQPPIQERLTRRLYHKRDVMYPITTEIG